MNGFSNDNSFVNNNGVSTPGNISINASGVFTSSLSENSILATEIAKSNTRIETVDLDAIFFKTENEVSEEEVQKIMNDGSSDSATSQPDTKLRSNSTGSVGSYGDSSDSVDTSSILRSNSAGSAFTNGMGSNLEIIKKVPRQNVIDAQKKVEEKKSALAAAEKDLEDARKNPNITSQELQQKEINYDNAKKQYVQADDEFKNVIKNASESEAAAGGDSSSFLDSLKGAADAATDDILTQKASDAAANSGLVQGHLEAHLEEVIQVVLVEALEVQAVDLEVQAVDLEVQAVDLEVQAVVLEVILLSMLHQIIQVYQEQIMLLLIQLESRGY